MLSEVEHGVLEGFLQSLLIRVVCLEVRLDERTFEATAVVESEGESVVLTHALNLAGYTFAEDVADVSCLIHLSGVEGLEVFDFFVVDAEAEGFLKFRVPHAVQPHAVVVRCTLYMRGLKASVLQYLDCVFALFLCHVHRSMITPLDSRASVIYSGSSKHPSYPVRRTSPLSSQYTSSTPSA